MYLCVKRMCERAMSSLELFEMGDSGESQIGCLKQLRLKFDDQIFANFESLPNTNSHTY